MITYLEYKDDKSSKFWEIIVNDEKVLINFGKIGTNGQVQKKYYDNNDAAMIEANKAINQKLKKGYKKINDKCQINIYDTKTVLKEINDILINEYKEGFAYAFLGENNDINIKNEIKLIDFKEKIDCKLPDSFYMFYEWIYDKDFEYKDIEKYTYLDDYDQNIFSLSRLLHDTNEWKDIQKEQPDREWRKGFVAWNCWGSAYQMAIDTEGIIDEQGCLVYWDYKGGSHYYIQYKSFEHLLNTKLELLRKKLYFPPSLDDDEKFEDYLSGHTRDLIDYVIEKINGKEKYKEIN